MRASRLRLFRGIVRRAIPFLAFLSFIPSVQAADLDQLAVSPGWLHLLHMERTLWGGYRSEFPDKAVFLSGHRDNPRAELDATLASLHAPPTGDPRTDVRCRFPARVLFLQTKLSLSFTTTTCPKYEAFKNTLHATSASVVFSSYYLNNPSSAFGHSFLRLSAEPADHDAHELLDYGVSFGANPTTSNPVLYAFMGLFGFFPGTWTNMPYYYKVREYNDFESRDLWSFDLNLTPAEIDLLVAHLWEVGQTYFSYFYFTKNCSYYILAVLEAAAPEYDLTARLHTHVIPADTIKTIYQTPGLVTGVSYRPSMRTQLLTRYEALSRADQKALLKIVRRETLEPLASVKDPLERAKIVDAAMDYEDVRHAQDSPVEKAAPSFGRALMRERSHLPTLPELKISPRHSDYPNLGSPSHRLGVFTGSNENTKGYSLFHYRFALHDFADSTTGYPEYAMIEFFSMLERYNWRNHQWLLEDFSAFQVVSLSPWNDLQHPISWEIKVGSTTVRDDRCATCFAPEFEVGGGLTTQAGPDTLFSLIWDGQALGSSQFTHGLLQFATGPKLRGVFRARERFQAVWTSAYLIDLRANHSYDWQNELIVQWNFTPQLAARLDSRMLANTVKAHEKEGDLGLLYYF